MERFEAARGKLAGIFFFVCALASSPCEARLIVLLGPLGPILPVRAGFSMIRNLGVGRTTPPSAGGPVRSSLSEGLTRLAMPATSMFPDSRGTLPRAEGVAPAPSAVIGRTPTGNCLSTLSGKHGNGDCDSGPVVSRRAVASFVGPDGRLTVGACRDFYSAVCGSTNRSDEEKRVEEMYRDAIKTYLAQSGLSFSKFSLVVSNFTRNPQRLGTTFDDYLAFLGNRAPGFDSAVRETMTNLQTAVESAPFAPERKDVMRSALARVTVRSYPPAGDENARRIFAVQCGPLGLSQGAYSVPQTGEVVICPGMVLRAVATGGDLSTQLAGVIGHELTHQFGADIDPRSGTVSPFRPEFERLGRCLANRRPREFDARGMLGEAVADIMALQAMAPRLKEVGPAAAFSLVRSTISPLCGTQADGVHPSGRFRIEVLLGDMKELLGCRRSEEACNL